MKTTRNTSSVGFIFDCLTDGPGLAARLRTGPDPLSVHLLGRFNEEARAVVLRSETPPDAAILSQLLSEELVRVIKGGSLYDEARFTGIDLRPMTLAVLAKAPSGIDLIWLNRLLIRDAYSGYLSHKASTLVANWEVSGIGFVIYCEIRDLDRSMGVSYKIIYQTAAKTESKHAKSLEMARGKIIDIAKQIHNGAPPPDKQTAKERGAKSDSYDQIIHEIAKAGIDSPARAFDFVKDAVAAQMELGPTRRLRKFVSDAIEVLPKPEKEVFLKVALARYQAHQQSLARGGKKGRNSKINVNKRFVAEILVCEEVGKELTRKCLLTGGWDSDDLVIARLINDGKLSEKLGSALNPATDIHAHTVTPLGIAVWLRTLGVKWKRRRDSLDNLRDFFVYLRDHLHAVAQVAKTAAHLVPRPSREGNKQPVAILWPFEVWTILANVQDLETVFFFAMGVYAGLHEAEMFRLDWCNVIWEGDRAIQIFIPAGMGKEPHGATIGKFVDVRYPLDKILALGRKLQGRIVTNGSTWKTKLRPLLLRLRIVWVPSIMRHTCATFLNGIRVHLDEVARQLRDKPATVLTYYIRQIPQPEAAPMWTLPMDISDFANLPERLRFWKWRTPLKHYDNVGTIIPEPELPSNDNSKTDNNSQPETGIENLDIGKRTRKRHRRYPWPTNDVLQVLICDFTEKEIAAKIGCKQNLVSAHLLSHEIWVPRGDYRLRKRKGLPVEEPACVQEARSRVGNGNEPITGLPADSLPEAAPKITATSSPSQLDDKQPK